MFRAFTFLVLSCLAAFAQEPVPLPPQIVQHFEHTSNRVNYTGGERLDQYMYVSFPTYRTKLVYYKRSDSSTIFTIPISQSQPFQWLNTVAYVQYANATSAGVPMTFSSPPSPAYVRFGTSYSNGFISEPYFDVRFTEDLDGISGTHYLGSGTTVFEGVIDPVRLFFDPDTNSWDLDPDGDGIPNESDTDDDNDGIPDTNDPDHPDYDSSDTDGDGQIDASDTDDDNDGLPDTEDPHPETPENPERDTDGDGSPDSVDSDDDGDGLSDVNDTRKLIPDKTLPPKDPNQDTDSDGTPDSTDTDDDGDGISDGFDSSPGGSAGGTGTTGSPGLGGVDGDGVATTGGTWNNDGAVDDATAKVLNQGAGTMTSARSSAYTKISSFKPLENTSSLPKIMTYSAQFNFGRFGSRPINIDFSHAPFPQVRLAIIIVMTWILGNAFFKRASV